MGGFYLDAEVGGPLSGTAGGGPGGRPAGPQALGAVLQALQEASGIEGSILVSARGLAMAASLPPPLDPQHLAAMAGTFAGSGAKVAEALGLGRPRMAVLEGRSRLLILLLFSGLTLAGILPKAGNLGLAIVEMERAAERIRELLALAAPDVEVDEAKVSQVVGEVAGSPFLRSLLDQLEGRP